MKKRSLLWLVLIIFIITSSGAFAWNEDGSILDYNPETDTVGSIPRNAGGETADKGETDRFTFYSREGGAGVSDICVTEEGESRVIRFYSTDKYTSGNQNVYMFKKVDLSSAATVISTRIKGFNSQTSNAEYHDRKMFPQIALRAAANKSKKQAIFTMYNGKVTTGDVGGTAIGGAAYENEWHDVLLKITPDGTNALNIDYYFDGKRITSEKFDKELFDKNAIDTSDVFITFGGYFRSGDAECFYDAIRVYRQTAQEFALAKSENVSLNASINISFKNQLDPQSLSAENVQITAGGVSVPIGEIIPNAEMDAIEVKPAENFNEKTEYSVAVKGLVDMFGQECDASATFVTGEATLSIEDITLECDGMPLDGLQDGIFTVNVSVNNQTKQEQGVTAAAALYKGSAMTKLFVTPYKELAPGQADDISLDVNAGDLSDGDYTLKIFCMNDMQRFVALKSAAVFTEAEMGTPGGSQNQAVIEVKAANASDGQLITLAVLDKGKTIDMIDRTKPETAETAIIHMDQAETNQDGICEFRFDFPHEMGEYIYVSTDEYGNTEQGSFFYYTQEDIDKTTEDLNNADEDDFTSLMAKPEVQKLLKLDTLVLDRMTDKEKTSVLETMYREHTGDAKPHTAEQFADMFSRAVFTVEVSSASNAAEVEKLMDKYSDSLAMSEQKMYNIFTKTLSTDLRSEVYRALAGEKFEDIADFYDRVDLYTVTKTLPHVSNWKEASAILKETEAAMKLGLNLSGYSSLKDPSVVDLIMIKATLTDWKTIIDTFNTAVADCKDKEKKPNYAGGGGSSGGGGGGGGLSSGLRTSSLGSLSLTDKNLYPVEELEPIAATETENLTFDDLDSVDWAKESILYLKDKGIVNGKGDGHFCPEDYITREEYITMVVSALEIFNEYAVCSFEDAQPEQWYYPYVASAYENGIVDGIDENNFGIGMPITRQDAAVMSCRALEFIEVSLKKTDDVTAFKDDTEISDYARDAVYDMNRAGVISGYEDEIFRPEECITRAETACVIYRVLKAIETAYTID